MISDAFDMDDSPYGWSRQYKEWIYESISQNTASGKEVINKWLGAPFEIKEHMQSFWNDYWKGYFAKDEEVQKQVDEVNLHFIEDAIRYVENLLNAQYAQGKLKLYRGIDLVHPEDFDPTEVGQSWTPVRLKVTLDRRKFTLVS